MILQRNWAYTITDFNLLYERLQRCDRGSPTCITAHNVLSTGCCRCCHGPQFSLIVCADARAVGATRSEGGFDAGKVATAALLDVQEANDKAGRQYYKYEIFTRTGDSPLAVDADHCCCYLLK
jgi:hypothetical protein